MKSYTFNRPIALLFALPLLLLIAMFAYGLTVEFRVSLLLMLLLSATVVVLLFYLGMLRRMEIGNGKAVWKTPSKRYEMNLSEVRFFGVVKFRSFRFMYLSRCEEHPFEDAAKPFAVDENTFFVQYRQEAWQQVCADLALLHPTLKPTSITRQ